MNKKGAVGFSEYWEIILTLVLFIIVVLIALYFTGTASLTVDAKIEAQNAAFTCKNNIVTFLLFPTKAGGSFDDFILKSYAENNYVDFQSNTVELFDKLVGVNKWRITLSNSAQEVVKFGEVGGRKIENCVTYIPTPCRADTDCRLALKLEMIYP